MEIFSIQAVAEATGLRAHQLKYLLESNHIVPDRRLNVGRYRYRWFTQKDIDKLVHYLQEDMGNE